MALGSDASDTVAGDRSTDSRALLSRPRPVTRGPRRSSGAATGIQTLARRRATRKAHRRGRSAPNRRIRGTSTTLFSAALPRNEGRDAVVRLVHPASTVKGTPMSDSAPPLDWLGRRPVGGSARLPRRTRVRAQGAAATPPDPPRTEEIIAVMRSCGEGATAIAPAGSSRSSGAPVCASRKRSKSRGGLDGPAPRPGAAPRKGGQRREVGSGSTRPAAVLSHFQRLPLFGDSVFLRLSEVGHRPPTRRLAERNPGTRSLELWRFITARTESTVLGLRQVARAAMIDSAAAKSDRCHGSRARSGRVSTGSRARYRASCLPLAGLARERAVGARDGQRGRRDRRQPGVVRRREAHRRPADGDHRAGEDARRGTARDGRRRPRLPRARAARRRAARRWSCHRRDRAARAGPRWRTPPAAAIASATGARASSCGVRPIARRRRGRARPGPRARDRRRRRAGRYG